MRVAISCRPSYGHLGPLMLSARGLAQLGHEVTFVSGRRFCSVIQRHGFAARAAGMDWASAGAPMDRVMTRQRLGRDWNAVTARALAVDLRKLWAAERPDLVVGGSDFASVVVAEEMGLPFVVHQVGVDLSVRRVEMARVVGGLRAAAHLDVSVPVPTIASVTVSPASFDEDPSSRSIRVRPSDRGVGADAWRRLALCASLGTVNHDPGLLSRVAQALELLKLPSLLCTGPGRSLDYQPSTCVTIREFAPYSEMFGTVRAVIGHGGFGTTMESLANGCPLVSLPGGSDQVYNAERSAELGAGVVLSRATSPKALAEAVSDVLSTPRFHQAAEKVAEEIARMPAPKEAMETLLGALD